VTRLSSFPTHGIQNTDIDRHRVGSGPWWILRNLYGCHSVKLHVRGQGGLSKQGLSMTWARTLNSNRPTHASAPLSTYAVWALVEYLHHVNLILFFFFLLLEILNVLAQKASALIADPIQVCLQPPCSLHHVRKLASHTLQIAERLRPVQTEARTGEAALHLILSRRRLICSGSVTFRAPSAPTVSGVEKTAITDSFGLTPPNHYAPPPPSPAPSRHWTHCRPANSNRHWIARGSRRRLLALQYHQALALPCG
jgi:hypothetical protein